MDYKRLAEDKKHLEAASRLMAPQHIFQNQFTEHQKIEGYFESRNVPDFYGCDRLLKVDTLYGTIQLGYDPKKGQSFLFSNIKTSIYDTAASAYQKNLWENQMMKSQKTGNQNLAYSSRRKESSATILYKMENMPWTERSVTPYLNRINMETLRKTMPFMNSQEEINQREEGRERKKELEQKIRESDETTRSTLRTEEKNLSHRQDQISSILYRKQTQSRLFFRKINIAFDLQKQRIFDYYRKEREKRILEAENASAVKPEDVGDNDENK